MKAVNEMGNRRRAALSITTAILAFSVVSLAQYDKKPYTEWSEKEANKVLNDSPWSQTHTPEQMLGRLKALADGPFPDYVVVAVTCDSDRGSDMLQQANETLRRATTAVLANKTYLITNDGQRIYLKEYQTPRNDGFGARFIFPRIIDGKEMLSSSSLTGEVVFHTEMGGGSDLNSGVTTSDTATGYGFTLHTRYKVKEMTFNGRLEY